jgi:hypothetical protein
LGVFPAYRYFLFHSDVILPGNAQVLRIPGTSAPFEPRKTKATARVAVSH